MAATPQFGGADPLRSVSRRAERWVAANPLRAETEDALRDVLPDVRREVPKTTRRLPETDGLADRVAKTHIDGIPFVAGGSAGVRIRGRANAVKDPDAINRGRVRHPTGWRVKSGPWVIQLVPKDWFTDAVRSAAPELRRRLQTAVRKSQDKF